MTRAEWDDVVHKATALWIYTTWTDTAIESLWPYMEKLEAEAVWSTIVTLAKEGRSSIPDPNELMRSINLTTKGSPPTWWERLWRR